MARPQKNGLDYFPLDTTMDDKTELLEAKYGVEGFGVLLKLWQKIYANSYYMEWNEEKLLLFKKAVNVDINRINDIINDCFRWQIFDQNLYDRHGILTSNGIQKRYIEATQRRKEVEFYSEYLLVEKVTEKYGKTVNVNINRINADIYSKKDYIGTQSKVKESKVKESKEEEVARGGANHGHRGLHGNVILDDYAYEQLRQEMGEAALKDYVNRLDGYLVKNPRFRGDHGSTILRWYNEDEAKRRAERIDYDGECDL